MLTTFSLCMQSGSGPEVFGTPRPRPSSQLTGQSCEEGTQTVVVSVCRRAHLARCQRTCYTEPPLRSSGRTLVTHAHCTQPSGSDINTHRARALNELTRMSTGGWAHANESHSCETARDHGTARSHRKTRASVPHKPSISSSPWTPTHPLLALDGNQARRHLRRSSARRAQY